MRSIHAPEQEVSLHFYPADNMLYIMRGERTLAQFPAKGGDPRGNPVDGYESTAKGTFTVYNSWAHENSAQWAYSKIKYGEKVRIRLSDCAVFTMHAAKATLRLTRKEVQTYYGEYKTSGWIIVPYYLNDFGHITVYYWKDTNNNGKIDGKEKIHNHMIHSTPMSEKKRREKAEHSDILDYSHGCIHMKSSDLDKLITYITPRKTKITIH